MKTHTALSLPGFRVHPVSAGIIILFISCFYSLNGFSQRDRGERQGNRNRTEGFAQGTGRNQSVSQQTPGAVTSRRSQAISNINSNQNGIRRFPRSENNNVNIQSQSGRYSSGRANINRAPSNHSNPGVLNGANSTPNNVMINSNNVNRRANSYNLPGNSLNRRGIRNYNPQVNGFNNRKRSFNNYNNYKRPVYNTYNPNWCYAHTPRRNSFFNTLPSSYININFGGFGYRYYDGIYYRPYNSIFKVVAAPIGIYINTLPVGYRKISVRNYPYYYYNGTYYDHKNNYYAVVSPPVGAIVESIPDGFETLTIDGETYYTVDGAQYKPVVQENGEIWYEVVKSN